jgi:hypothetical protein
MKIDILKFIKFEELSATERERLKKRLQARKDLLNEALKVVDDGLKKLAAAPPKAAKAPKRKK